MVEAMGADPLTLAFWLRPEALAMLAASLITVPVLLGYGAGRLLGPVIGMAASVAWLGAAVAVGWWELLPFNTVAFGLHGWNAWQWAGRSLAGMEVHLGDWRPVRSYTGAEIRAEWSRPGRVAEAEASRPGAPSRWMPCLVVADHLAAVAVAERKRATPGAVYASVVLNEEAAWFRAGMPLRVKAEALANGVHGPGGIAGRFIHLQPHEVAVDAPEIRAMDPEGGTA